MSTKRCGKVYYPTRARAERAIKAIRRNGRGDGGDGSGRKPQRAYLCPACSGWHLTSQAG